MPCSTHNVSRCTLCFGIPLGLVEPAHTVSQAVGNHLPENGQPLTGGRTLFLTTHFHAGGAPSKLGPLIFSTPSPTPTQGGGQPCPVGDSALARPALSCVSTGICSWQRASHRAWWGQGLSVAASVQVGSSGSFWGSAQGGPLWLHR